MTRLVALAARYWPPATAIVLAAITALSLAPLPELPLPAAALNDKLQHAAAYAALALPVALARPRHWGLVLLGYLAWGAGIELVQPLVNRVGGLADLAANAAGLALGVLLATLLRRAARAAT